MNSVLATFILIIIVIGLALGVLSFVSANSTTFFKNANIVKQAESYSSQVQISASQPTVQIITPTSSGIKSNYSVSYVVTFNIPGYSGNLILFPFLVSSNANLGVYNPFSVPYVSSPNYVGYVNISPSTQISFNNQIIYASNNVQLQVSGKAYKIPNGQTVFISYTTDSPSKYLMIWVIVNISGQLYRISYPVFPSSQLSTSIISGQQSGTQTGQQSGSSSSSQQSGFIYTQEGILTLGKATFVNYLNYLKQIYGNYSLAYYVVPSVTKNLVYYNGRYYYVIGDGNIIINLGNKNLGYFANFTLNYPLAYVGNTKIYANKIGLANTSLTGFPNFYTNATFVKVNSYPPFSISLLEGPILSSLNGIKFVQNNSPSITFNNVNKVFTQPTVFKGSVTIQNSVLTFYAPVRFDGPVTINGNVKIIAYAPIIFNGTGTYFYGQNINITSTKAIIFTERGNVTIGSTSPYSLPVQVTFGGITIINSNYTFTNSPIFGYQVLGVTNILVQGPLIAYTYFVYQGYINLTVYGYLIRYPHYNPYFQQAQNYINPNNIPPWTFSQTVLSNMPPININVTVTQYIYLTDYLQSWFEIIPNNAQLPVFNLTFAGSGGQAYLLGITLPVNYNVSKLNIYFVNSSGQFLISSVNVNSYAWYFLNVSISFPSSLSISLYNTTYSMISKSLKVNLPTNPQLILSISNEPFSQLLFISQNISAPIPSIYGGGKGYITNYTSYLSNYRWQQGQVAVYYYLVTNNLGASYVAPSFAYPPSYYSMIFQVNQRMVGVSP